jgi:hypothetical protein
VVGISSDGASLSQAFHLRMVLDFRRRVLMRVRKKDSDHTVLEVVDKKKMRAA